MFDSHGSPGEARRLAHHAAGHVLCARLVDIPVSLVRLDGHERIHALLDHPAGIRAALTATMGGFAAEVVIGQTRAVRGGQDLAVAAEMARRLTPDGHQQLEEIGAALRRAIDLLRAHPAALAELARTVAARGAIVGPANVALAVNVALARRA